MSTATYARHLKDDAPTKTLDALVKAQELAVYTISICSNPKKFDPKFAWMVDKLIGASVDIYCLADQANNVMVANDPVKWHERRKLQEQSAARCNKLLSLISLSKKVFHISGNRVQHWSQMASETRSLIRAWVDSDRKRYGHLDGV